MQYKNYAQFMCELVARIQTLSNQYIPIPIKFMNLHKFDSFRDIYFIFELALQMAAMKVCAKFQISRLSTFRTLFDTSLAS